MRRSGSERLVWSRGQLSRAPWTLMTQRQVWFSIRITESSFGGSDQVRFMFSKRALSAVERRELGW